MDVDSLRNPLANVSASSVEEIQRPCTECVDTVSVDGDGVSLMTSRGHSGTVWSSDPVAARVEDLQFTLGEGPCYDATSSGTPILIADVEDRREGLGNRWPGFLAELADMEVRANFGLPLRIGTIRLGAMDLYRHQPGPLSRSELSNALRTADAATRALLDLGAGGPAPDNEAAGSSYRFAVRQTALSNKHSHNFEPLPTASSAPSTRLPWKWSRVYVVSQGRICDRESSSQHWPGARVEAGRSAGAEVC